MAVFSFLVVVFGAAACASSRFVGCFFARTKFTKVVLWCSAVVAGGACRSTIIIHSNNRSREISLYQVVVRVYFYRFIGKVSIYIRQKGTQTKWLAFRDRSIITVGATLYRFDIVRLHLQLTLNFVPVDAGLLVLVVLRVV